MGKIDSRFGLAFFKLVERALLLLTAGLTIIAAVTEVWNIYIKQEVGLADILLMFLYVEVISMIAVFYTGIGSPFIYPIFIAITAIARLIVLQGKDMAPEKVVLEAGAILILAIAVVVVGYAKRN
ncbi:phosphate-starvation-inducible PsiE family protein [Hyphomonas sp.]|uniref:phosphate-starvation-inducible protein PsiE n=1 Tax=Hyphomonas sp. TaxID=87 RepID=UPI00333EDF2F